MPRRVAVGGENIIFYKPELELINKKKFFDQSNLDDWLWLTSSFYYSKTKATAFLIALFTNVQVFTNWSHHEEGGGAKYIWGYIPNLDINYFYKVNIQKL